MALFNGNDLVLAIGTAGSEQSFAHAQSCSISFSNSLIDATTKDSNSWEEVISGRRGVTISTNGLADFDDVSSMQAVEQFSDLAIGNSPRVSFMFTRSTQSDGTALQSGDFIGWQGMALIENFDISSTSDELVTYSASLTVTGALTKVVAT